MTGLSTKNLEIAVALAIPITGIASSYYVHRTWAKWVILFSAGLKLVFLAKPSRTTIHFPKAESTQGKPQKERILLLKSFSSVGLEPSASLSYASQQINYSEQTFFFHHDLTTEP